MEEAATAAAILGHCDAAAAAAAAAIRINLDTFKAEGNAVVAIPEATTTEILSEGKSHHPRSCGTNFPPCSEEHFVAEIHPAVEEDRLSIGDSVLNENIELPPSYQDACMV